MKTTAAKNKLAAPSSGLGGIVVSLFLIALLAVFLSPWAAQALIQNRLSKTTGLSVNMTSVHFGLTRPHFVIKNLEFANPKGFPAAPLAQISNVEAKYSPVSILLGRPHFRKVRIDFKEFRLIRNDKGNLNLPLIPVAVSSGTTIDEVELNLNSLTYTDLSTGQPTQQVFNLGLVNSVYRNVKGVLGIEEILGWEILKRTGVPEKKTAAPKPIVELRAAVQNVPPQPLTAPVSHGPTPSQSAPSPAPLSKNLLGKKA